MTLSIEPYLKVFRSQLASSLLPRDDENARRVAVYFHRILTVLLLRSETLPGLQRAAVEQLSGILDELIGALSQIEGSTILIAQLFGHIRNRPDYAEAEPFLQSAVRLLAANPTPERNALLRKISGITFGIQQGLHQIAQDDDLKPVAGETIADPLGPVHREALQAYLRRQYPGEMALEVGKAKLIIGGGSKQTMFLDLHHTRELPEAVVLRVDKADGVVDSSVSDEYSLLELAYQAGLPVPRPFVLETDPSVLGASFVIVGRLEGRNIGDWIDVTEPSRAFAVALAQTLAKLHQIAPERAGTKLRGATTTIRERMAQEIAAFEHSWRSTGFPSIALEQAYAWLKDHMELAEGKRAIIHCDVGCHNMLAQNGELTALLDWETAAIGNPAQDLAYVRHTIIQMMPWEEFLAEYEAAGGVIPSNGEMDFYRLWRGAFTMHYQLMASAFFNSGMSSTVILAYASLHLLRRLDYDLHESVKLAYERY